MELDQKVKAYKLTMACENNGCNGEMQSIGSLLMVFPPKYEHICNVCGRKETYNKPYPTIEFK